MCIRDRAFNSNSVSNVLSASLFLFAKWTIPPKLNNRSTGTMERNHSAEYYSEEEKLHRLNKWREAKMVCVRNCRVQIVFQIQITVKNVIKIQNTKCISKWAKYKIQITYNVFQIHILTTCISITSQLWSYRDSFARLLAQNYYRPSCYSQY